MTVSLSHFQLCFLVRRLLHSRRRFQVHHCFTVSFAGLLLLGLSVTAAEAAKQDPLPVLIKKVEPFGETGPAAPFLVKAEALEHQGRYREAIAQYDSAVKLRPDNGIIYWRRGRVHVALRDFDLAMADFQKAHKLWPRAIEPLFDMAQLHSGAMEDELAIKDLTEILAIEPRNLSIWHTRALANETVGQYEQAITDLNKYVSLAGACDPDTKRKLGTLYFKIGKYEKAIEYFNLTLAANPAAAHVRDQRAEAYFKLKNYKAAVSDFSAELKKIPRPDLLRRRAEAYRRLGQSILAAKDEQAARAIGNEAFESAPFRFTKGVHD